MRKGMIIAVASTLVLLGISFFVTYKALDYRRHVNYFLEKYTNVVTEFSGRNKYAADNQRLMAGSPQSKRIVFIGDQIIESWDLERYFKDFEVINRGITGQRLSGFLLRLRPDVLELKPRAVIIQFSSYNFRPQGTIKEVQDYLTDLAQLCRCNGVEPVLTTIIPVREKQDIYKSEEFQSYAVADSLAKFNDWLKDYCKENGYILADFYHALVDKNGFLPGELSIDNTHLNQAGFERLAVVATRVLKELLEKPGNEN